MCILFIRLLKNVQNSDYKLILASNRDEHFKRPAKSAHFWDENPLVFGGKDMTAAKENGTWLAMSKAGKIGVLLSVTGEISDPEKLGRGPIVANFVRGQMTDDDYMKQLAEDGDKINKFHLVTVTIDSRITRAKHFTNSPSSSTDNIQDITSEFIGVGNSAFSTPFKKVQNGEKRFKEIVGRHGRVESKDELLENLLSLLKWEEPHYPDEVLESKGKNVPEEYMRQYSAVFVNIPGAEYGTRTHTIILVDKGNNVEFFEWTLEPNDNGVTSEREWRFTKQEFKLIE